MPCSGGQRYHVTRPADLFAALPVELQPSADDHDGLIDLVHMPCMFAARDVPLNLDAALVRQEPLDKPLDVADIDTFGMDLGHAEAVHAACSFVFGLGILANGHRGLSFVSSMKYCAYSRFVGSP